MKKVDHVSACNVNFHKIPAKLKKSLNNFFNEVDCAEGCGLYKGSDLEYSAPFVLIIEDSILYDYLSGEYGWSVHTKFYDAFEGTGFRPEMINSCAVGFYKD